MRCVMEAAQRCGGAPRTDIVGVVHRALHVARGQLMRNLRPVARATRERHCQRGMRVCDVRDPVTG